MDRKESNYFFPFSPNPSPQKTDGNDFRSILPSRSPRRSLSLALFDHAPSPLADHAPFPLPPTSPLPSPSDAAFPLPPFSRLAPKKQLAPISPHCSSLAWRLRLAARVSPGRRASTLLRPRPLAALLESRVASSTSPPSSSMEAWSCSPASTLTLFISMSGFPCSFRFPRVAPSQASRGFRRHPLFISMSGSPSSMELPLLPFQMSESKWLVAALYGLAILWKRDAEVLWAAIGSIINSWLSITLKRILNHERPVSGLRSDPGMPIFTCTIHLLCGSICNFFKFKIWTFRICVVGDRLDTDKLFGQNTGGTNLSDLQHPSDEIHPGHYAKSVFDAIGLSRSCPI